MFLVRKNSGRQSSAESLPCAETVSPGQRLHACSDVPPLSEENLPAAQSVQASSPIAALYFPATQTTHVSPFGPVKPALQTQAEAAALPAGANEFAGHAKHENTDFAPTVVEYLPAPQLVQGRDPLLTSVLYLPASHAVQATPSGPV